jgi:hypothetical protein
VYNPIHRSNNAAIRASGHQGWSKTMSKLTKLVTVTDNSGRSMSFWTLADQYGRDVPKAYAEAHQIACISVRQDWDDKAVRTLTYAEARQMIEHARQSGMGSVDGSL